MSSGWQAGYESGAKREELKLYMHLTTSFASRTKWQRDFVSGYEHAVRTTAVPAPDRDDYFGGNERGYLDGLAARNRGRYESLKKNVHLVGPFATGYVDGYFEGLWELRESKSDLSQLDWEALELALLAAGLSPEATWSISASLTTWTDVLKYFDERNASLLTDGSYT